MGSLRQKNINPKNGYKESAEGANMIRHHGCKVKYDDNKMDIGTTQPVHIFLGYSNCN